MYLKIVRAENSYGRAVSENNQAYQQVEVVERCTLSLCMGAADAIVTIREQKSNRIDNISLGDLKVFLWCGALVALRVFIFIQACGLLKISNTRRWFSETDVVVTISTCRQRVAFQRNSRLTRLNYISVPFGGK